MKRTPALLSVFVVSWTLAACGSSESTSESTNDQVAVSTFAGSDSTSVDPEGDSTDGDSPFISATLGDPVEGFDAPVDIAVRPGDPAQTLIAEQGGLIREIDSDGLPGVTVADLTALTEANGEQGLLGLAFDLTGDRAFVNYTDLNGDTTVDQFDVSDDGTFVAESRRTVYSLAQPYRNHNGGDLLLMPDGNSLLIFNGDGGSANDPERLALDPTSELGKIIEIDISQVDPEPRQWARGLRNPWRASYDATTGNLWIADVGQNMWEEINVVALERSQGVSFGWSAFEGTTPFNDDQMPIHESLTTVDPMYTYPHENDDCSISGGFVYRGSEIPHSGSWYLFTDFCSGEVRALCINEDEIADKKTSCGIVSLGSTPSPVGILADALGRPWVLSITGSIIPIVPKN